MERATRRVVVVAAAAIFATALTEAKAEATTRRQKAKVTTRARTKAGASLHAVKEKARKAKVMVPKAADAVEADSRLHGSHSLLLGPRQRLAPS